MYEMNFLPNIVQSKSELENRTYHSKASTQFLFCERGKVRPITGLQMSDRVIRHSLCDNVLTPSLNKYLIYDNGASLQGKGITFSRKRLETHLHDYYRKHGNEGYILLMDYSKFYDNIPHEIAYNEIAKHIDDEFALWLLEGVFKNFEVDVSYMSDEEYSQCMKIPFNSTDYRLKIDKSLLTGEKYMRKSVNIGDQCSQIIGIYYPTPIDNYIKIVKGVKYYGRYMDDSYIISDNLDFLKELQRELPIIANKYGIILNEKKTHIAKLSESFRFLQTYYSLTSTGRLIRKINSKRIHAMRRKLKKLSRLVKAGARSQEEIENMFKGWMGCNCKIMSRRQRDNMNILYYELFGGFLDHEYYLRYYPRRWNEDQRLSQRQ